MTRFHCLRRYLVGVAVSVAAASVCSAIPRSTEGQPNHVESASTDLGEMVDEGAEHQCKVHHAAMDIEVVPIRYGLVRMYLGGGSLRRRWEFRRATKYWNAHDALFPNANLWLRGGCIVGSEESAQTHYCASCREARRTWLNRNPWAAVYEQ